MGFCPELARPLGALILIAWKAGRRGRVSKEVTAVRFSAAVTVLETKKRLPPPSSVQGLFSWDVSLVAWPQLSADSYCAVPEVKREEPGCKHVSHVTNDEGIAEDRLLRRCTNRFASRFIFYRNTWRNKTGYSLQMAQEKKHKKLSQNFKLLLYQNCRLLSSDFRLSQIFKLYASEFWVIMSEFPLCLKISSNVSQNVLLLSQILI